MKVLSIIIFSFSLYTLLRDKKKISDESLLLVIIFLGGFCFHFIWEMKSRYTLPYLIILIPFASIGISRIVNILNKKINTKIELKNKIIIKKQSVNSEKA